MRGSLVERQSELLLRSDVPGPGVRGRPFFPGLYAEQVFGAGFGLEGAEPDGGRGALARGRRRHVETAALQYALVGRYFPGEVVAVGRGEEITVVYDNPSGSKVVRREPDGLEYVFALQCRGLQRTVGVDDAVAAERRVVMLPCRFEIPAVGPISALAGVFFDQPLLCPVPDMAAQQSLMAADDRPVVVQPAGRISHRVGVFAHQHGAVDPRVEGHALQLPDRGIHAAHDIHVGGVGRIAAVLRLLRGARLPVCGGGTGEYGRRSAPEGYVKRARRLSLRPFVVDQARGVVIFGPAGCRRVRRAASRFVAQRPHDDGGVVAVADDHPAHTLQKRNGPLRVVRELPARTVALDVGFVDDVKAVTVAQLVEIGVVGVVGRTHGVEIQQFHQPYVLFHPFARDGLSRILVVVVAVYAVEFHGNAVDQHLASAEPDVAEPDLAAARFGDLPVIVAQGQHEGVERRVLGAPFFGRRDALLHQCEVDVVALRVSLRQDFFDR